MKKIKDLPKNKRPREKLHKDGAISLADHELLAIILGSGNKQNNVISLSKKIKKIINIKGLELNVKDLIEINGIGATKAALITVAFEFVRRRIRPEGLVIKSAVDVLPQIQHYGDRKQEYFICVSVNGANEVMNVRVITIGLINRTQVHPREVFADVIKERASSVIIAHNHPNGTLKSSGEDFKVTKQIKEASEVLGINLLDHIIFNSKGYFSFLENHVL